MPTPVLLVRERAAAETVPLRIIETVAQLHHGTPRSLRGLVWTSAGLCRRHMFRSPRGVSRLSRRNLGEDDTVLGTRHAPSCQKGQS